MGGRTSRGREVITRQWRLVEALHGRRRGAGVAHLVQELGVSRSTLYRDIALLEQAGVRIGRESINGEVRFALHGEPLPARAPSPQHIAALVLARSLVSPLEGTALVGELDSLLKRATKAARPTVSARTRPGSKPAFAGLIEQALTKRKRLEISYGDRRTREVRARIVDPIELRLAGDHLYLLAWDLERRAPRTFKASRLTSARVLAAASEPHPEVNAEQAFHGAVKVWIGEPVDVAVRLTSEVSHLACEWPLHDAQRLEPAPDGGTIVRARVSGIVEAIRWVLGWGGDAEALEPAALRDGVLKELERALAHYARRGPRRVVSPIVRQPSRRIASARD